MKSEAVEYRLSIGGMPLISVSHEPLVSATEKHQSELNQARIGAVKAVTEEPLNEKVIAEVLNFIYLAERGAKVRREVTIFDKVTVPFFPRTLRRII